MCRAPLCSIRGRLGSEVGGRQDVEQTKEYIERWLGGFGAVGRAGNDVQGVILGLLMCGAILCEIVYVRIHVHFCAGRQTCCLQSNTLPALLSVCCRAHIHV